MALGAASFSVARFQILPNVHVLRNLSAVLTDGGNVPYVIGVLLALGVSISATLVGFDRDRVFYPSVTIVVASYYGLFAIMGGSHHALVVECIVMIAFLTASVLGFKRNLLWVVGALAGHGVFDFFHDLFIVNPGVPHWWPSFCLAYDVTAAVYLAWLLHRSRTGLQGV